MPSVGLSLPAATSSERGDEWRRDCVVDGAGDRVVLDAELTR